MIVARKVIQSPASTPTHKLSLGHAQMDRICREFGLANRSAVESAILDDLHSACGFEPKRPRDGSASAFGELDVFGLTRSYYMKSDEMTRDRLVVIAARERPCGWLEQRRETAITPIVEFRLWIGVEGGTHPDHT